MLRWGELSCRLLGSKASKDRILSQATYSGEVFENEEIQHICCRAQFSVFVLRNGRVYTLVNEQRWRGQPELVNGLEEHKIHVVDSGTSHILFVSEAGNVFFSEFQKKKRGVNTKPFNIAEPQLLRNFAEICVIQVACGNNHSLALCKDGQVFAWGQNTRGQLGLGAAGRCVLSPQCVTSLAGIPLAQIAAGGTHSFALSLSGAVFGWGRNDHGQLGLKDKKDRRLPTYVKLLECKKIVYISCGGQHTATLTKDGLVFTFGAGSYGQLGHNTKRDELKPRLVAELFGSKVSQIACGSYHTLVLIASSGKIYSFGRGEKGQLGNGQTSHQFVPRPVTFLMDIPDGVRLVPAAMSHGDSEPTVPERRRRVTRAAATKASTHKRTVAAQDLFTPTGATAKRMRISGAQGATPKFTAQPAAKATKTQCPTEPSRKHHLRSQLTKGRVPLSAQAKASKERITSSIVTDAHPNTQGSPNCGPLHSSQLQNRTTDCLIQPAVRRIFAGANQGFALCIGDLAPVSPEDQSPFIPLKRIATAEDSLLDKWGATDDEELWENGKEEINHIFSSAASLNGSFLETSKGNHFQTSSVASGVDMSAVNLWFEKLGKNPTLLQEVTNAVENKLIPSLSKSPAGVEALRVYLVLPELIDVQTEQNNMAKLTSLLSTAIVSLEESQLEILESWWSNLNEFFFKKLVTMYKSTSHRLLRERSSDPKGFPDKLRNCLNILQRLYKINSTASFKIQENSFYISPAEVFGGTPISCIALLQLIPYTCIFNMENKIKIFRRVSHLRIRGGVIVDENMNFGNNRNTEDFTGNNVTSSGDIGLSSLEIDLSTLDIDLSTENNDVSTGSIDVSTGNNYVSIGNNDVSTGNIDVSTGNNDVSTGNNDASTGNNDVSTGSIDVSTGNNYVSIGNNDVSTGNIDVSTGNNDVSTGNNDASTGNNDVSTGNIDVSTRINDVSTGNIDVSTRINDVSTGNVDASNGIVDASTGNTEASTGNIDAPNGKTYATNGIVDAATGNTDAPNGIIDAPNGIIESSTGDIDDFWEECDDDDYGYYVDSDYEDSDYDDYVDYEDYEDYGVYDEYDFNFYLRIFNQTFGFPGINLLINRTEILQNTLAQLRRCSDLSLRGLFQVRFKGESAVDQGGVSQEFFSVITKELCTQPKAFKLYEESRLVWFPEWDPEIEDLFHLVGILCWLALYHGYVADFHFPLALYKKLLKVRPTLDDLKELSPTVGQNLQILLNYEYDDIEDVFCRDFTIGREMDDGSIAEHELIPNGKNIPVQKHNRKQFVDAYVDYVFNTSVEKHFKAFSEGFRCALPLPAVDVFLPVELMAVIHGNTKYDWQLLEEHTKYHGYTKADKTIVNFWEMFHELTEEEKKHFLAFLTGCDRVPVGGMGSLSITIRCDVRDDPDLYFPAAHTCNRTLDLPKYSSVEILRERFLRAIGCSKGFGIA